MISLWRGEESLEQKWTPEPFSGCWLWIGSTDKKGYGQIRRNRKIQPAHRFVWELCHEPIPAGVWVLHRCDTPCCVNPDHLFLGTRQDNMRDCVKKGRLAYNGKSKLSADQVRQIRSELGYGTGRMFARRFGVTEHTICDVRSHRSWKHD